MAGSRKGGIPDEIVHASLDVLVGRWGLPSGVIEGGAVGVDQAGKDWAIARGLPVAEIPYGRGKRDGVSPSLWGKRRNWVMALAGQRNERELRAAVFWDGMSGGTAHMLAVLYTRRVPAAVVLLPGAEVLDLGLEELALVPKFEPAGVMP
ncbi:MAG TPA: hypothetical protein VEB22_15275 [Phycisphaerales bacterium]|nr:hypothetical protein [Phycisphaerales bacterium]